MEDSFLKFIEKNKNNYYSHEIPKFISKKFDNTTYFTYKEAEDYNKDLISNLPYKPTLKNCVLDALGNEI